MIFAPFAHQVVQNAQNRSALINPRLDRRAEVYGVRGRRNDLVRMER